MDIPFADRNPSAIHRGGFLRGSPPSPATSPHSGEDLHITTLLNVPNPDHYTIGVYPSVPRLSRVHQTWYLLCSPLQVLGAEGREVGYQEYADVFLQREPKIGNTM